MLERAARCSALLCVCDTDFAGRGGEQGSIGYLIRPKQYGVSALTHPRHLKTGAREKYWIARPALPY